MAIFEGRDKNALTPKFVREKYQTSSKAMRRERYEYAINRAFLSGDQWVYWDRPRDVLRSLPRDPARVRATINRMWPASRHLMAKLLSRPLVFEVPPASTDDATVRGAHIAQSVLIDLHREQNWEEDRETLAWSAWLGGTSVMALDWDPTKGPTLGTTPISGEPFGTGEICGSPLTILEVAWEPGTRDAERGVWWCRAQALPPAEVQATYNLKDTPKADASAAEGYIGRDLVREDRAETPVDLTLVLTYYERPNPKRPQGAVCTVVGDEFVDGPKPWHFPWKDRLNMVVFRETKVAGRATGDTVYSAAVPIQTAYNASWSNIIEHLKLAGNARLMVPEGSVEGLDELSDLPGEMFTFNSAVGAPEWLVPAQLPAWVLNEPDMLAKQMDDIMGLHEVSRGQAPSNIESGVGLGILVEQDSTPLGALTRELAHGFERFGTLVLRLYQDKVKETRTSRVRMQGQIPEVVSWTGKSLAGQVTAVVPMDAVMPRSRAAMLAFAERMMTMKLIPEDRPDVFAKMADIPDQDFFLEGIDPDAAKALRENHLMSIGQTPLPASFDLHATHIARHNVFRKSTRYETMDPEMRELVDLHIQGHETMAAEEAGLQLAKAQMSAALSAVPTANEAAPLPEGIVPAGGAGGPAGTQMTTGGPTTPPEGTATAGGSPVSPDSGGGEAPIL
jgi:hypothetical protein